MSDEVNGEIPPLKKFKKNEAASISNGESSLENTRRETNITNQGSGTITSNVNSPQFGGFHGAIGQLTVNQGTNITSPPIVRTLLHNENCLPSPWFSGREDYLRKLEEGVKQTQKINSKFHFVTVSGLWGMGKSQVARKFIEKCKDWPKIGGNIFWINASSGDQMVKSFLRLANHFFIDTQKLKLGQGQGQGQSQYQEQKEDVKKLVKDIYAHFDKYVGKGLFIFDGAKQFASPTNEFGVDMFLPKRKKISELIPLILVTSRSQYWPKGQVLPLGPLYFSESDDLLKNAFEISNTQSCANYFTSFLTPLSYRLGGFPMVLSQVSSKIIYTMETAYGPNWNENWPYNLGPKKMLNTKLEDEIKKFIKNWDKQSSLALLSAQELSNVPSHSDPYDNYLPDLWATELKNLVTKANTHLEHKMALELLKLMSYLPQHSISVKLLYFILNVLPINSQSIQSLTSTSFDDIILALGHLAQMSLITLDKSETECSGQITHHAFHHDDDTLQALGHVKFKDFFLGNNCGKIIILPLLQKLMRCSLQSEQHFQPLLKIVDFYIKNTKFCHEIFYSWSFFSHLKELSWPEHSYIAELYYILYIENALSLSSSSNWIQGENVVEKLQCIYSRLNKRGRKTAREFVHFQLCRISIIFLGNQNQLTCVKNDDFSTMLNVSNLFPRGAERNTINITRFLKSVVDLMMDFPDHFLLWFCGAQIFLQLNSRKHVNVSVVTHSNHNFHNVKLEYNVNNESFGDKRDHVITDRVWQAVMFGPSLKERIGKLVNLYFNTPSRSRKKRIMTEKDIELAEVMIEATGHLFDLPVYKKILMNVQFIDVYLNGGEGECECDEVKLRLWGNFVTNVQAIFIWDSWTPENAILEGEDCIFNYNRENSFKIKKYFLDIKGVKILQSSFLWFAKMLRKYRCVQINFRNVMISVFEILQELCFDPPLREQILESESFIASFDELFSAFMPKYFADKENVIQQFAALFSCAVSCLALSLPLPTRKKSKASSSKAKCKEEQALETNYLKLCNLEGEFFCKYSSWSQDIPNFPEKVKETIRRTKKRNQVILEKVMQTRSKAEDFKEDDLKTAQILMNFCLDEPTAGQV